MILNTQSYKRGRFGGAVASPTCRLPAGLDIAKKPSLEKAHSGGLFRVCYLPALISFPIAMLYAIT